MEDDEGQKEIERKIAEEDMEVENKNVEETKQAGDRGTKNITHAEIEGSGITIGWDDGCRALRKRFHKGRNMGKKWRHWWKLTGHTLERKLLALDPLRTQKVEGFR
ncbi:hypothetical protein HAX54_005904 [Datura stramonium]|uniref:Uncharacterized protein n=1 Tax=Datura stramonium TaxID=4076 RepID=A0ABS8TAD9_DATST|nr:hypothetical protein [Datura stramonium]